MIPRPALPWPFTREALERTAEEGGDRTCPTCGASCSAIVYPGGETNPEGYVRAPWCSSCWERPQWETKKGKPKQITMEV